MISCHGSFKLCPETPVYYKPTFQETTIEYQAFRLKIPLKIY